MKRIVVAVTNDLVTDQRVDRSCQALAEAGWQVTLIGRRLPDSPPLPRRVYAMTRMRLVMRRSALFYAEYNLRLLLRLLTMPADVIMANDTDTLPACCLAARLRKLKLVFDAHELFPDVPELAAKPTVRRVWRAVERWALPHVDAAMTVSQSVANEYHQRYGIEMEVVRNVPETDHYNGNTFDDKSKFDFQHPTLLYQGAVNVGRGVRELVDVIELLPQCRLVVAGDGDLLKSMQRYAEGLKWSERIEFLGRVEPQRLHRLTSQATLGFCLLEDLGLNYRYSLPNRVADFAQAGVPLLATEFTEIGAVLREYGTGTLTEACLSIKEGEEYHNYLLRLSAAINEALDYWASMPLQERQDRFARASKELCWNSEKHKLLRSLAKLVLD